MSDESARQINMGLPGGSKLGFFLSGVTLDPSLSLLVSLNDPRPAATDTGWPLLSSRQSCSSIVSPVALSSI